MSVRSNENVLKSALVLGSWMLFFGLLTAVRAEGGTVYIRDGADAAEWFTTSSFKAYDHSVETDEVDPLKFDHRDLFYGKFLTDWSFANALVHRWEADEHRFEYWHHYLWRVPDEIAHHHKCTRAPHTPDIPPHFPVPDPPCPGASGPGGAVTTVSTPEPSTWLMIVSGLGFLGLAMWRTRSAERAALS